MNTLIKILSFLILFTNTSFSQTTKILTRQFVTSSNLITIDFTDKVIVKNSKETNPRIYLKIETKLPPQTLDALVKSGRYDYETTVINGEFIISMPKLARKIIINGEEVSENLSVEILLPETIELKTIL